MSPFKELSSLVSLEQDTREKSDLLNEIFVRERCHDDGCVFVSLAGILGKGPDATR